MTRILILGAGVGGLSCAHRLRQRLPASAAITVFDQAPVHTFWPSLLWLMTGTRRPEQVSRPLTALREKGIEIVGESVTNIDPKARTVTAGGRIWHGDAVVIALGADLDIHAVPGLPGEAGNFYAVAGAQAVWESLRRLDHGKVVVLISRVPFKCPAAPYEAAMLIDGYLRRRRVREHIDIEVWAAEPTPMGVAGPAVSQAVLTALQERAITYHPNRVVRTVDPSQRRLVFAAGQQAGTPENTQSEATETTYDVLAYVPPHRVPAPVVAAGLAPPEGWVTVDRYTMETPFSNVFAVGDVTGIMLAVGKPLPKAGVFAHRQGEIVADLVAARLGGQDDAPTPRFDGTGECFIEMGGGIAGFARGNFYAEPTPSVRVFRPGRHWHAGKLAFERHWWTQWW